MTDIGMLPEKRPPVMSERVSGPLRLRSAGFGVVLGGLALLGLSLVLPSSVATGSLVGLAIVLGAGLRERGTWWVQLCLGVGAVGAIGLVETTTSLGLGFEAFEIGAIAVVFGVFDVVVGTLIHRFRPGTDAET